MLCLIIGAACLIGFIAWKRSGRRGFGRRHGFGGGCASRWDGEDDGRDRGGFWGRRGRGVWSGGGEAFVLRGLFERLDTSPGQEKVIRGAASEMRDAARKLKGEGRRSREDVAKALRGPAFDEALFGEAFARHDVAIEELRRALVGAIAKVHDALDERQRERLADLVESGRDLGRRAHRDAV